MLILAGMPDYVFSTTSSSFVNRFREQILPFDCMILPSRVCSMDANRRSDEKMKQFDLDMSKGAISNVDLIPPPSFSFGDVPFTYM